MPAFAMPVSYDDTLLHPDWCSTATLCKTRSFCTARWCSARCSYTTCFSIERAKGGPAGASRSQTTNCELSCNQLLSELCLVIMGPTWFLESHPF